ncbi:xanthine dehydrogenase family protein molybdopterin-binding subunit [Sinomicrobium weinanense]|uniref:Xanthine dehydrogenase family protein molybdopterin-binding subunit n=1 Tax=Sinomicrobium weinanense TaxID=2842200 RepID=A0A926JWF2_9FLAO|nr:molybdopterin cofactor-binding domain-containing protein [Sinomicrobium weinanense]MBC9798423.1 xanthine dehydrogenase family protein molybdopterin-binding subunit [Sinomicrobium weinanense]MBU3122712.1 molybdopterin-dependent oxidoreductase [Sinomicrobium weinanense]
MKSITHPEKTKENTRIYKPGRRDFLKLGSLAATGLVLGVNFSCKDRKKGGEVTTFTANVYLSITSEGKVIITAHRSEMGQGVRTSLPMIVADELGADWEKVEIVQAQGDEEKYGNQNTDGSFSVRMFYKPMREAGATARLLLIRAATQQWGVPEGECSTDNGKVVHKTSGKELGFGELVEAAASLAVPEIEEVPLKDPSEFKMIGKGMPIVDLQDIVTGNAVYGMDAVVPDMKIAVIQRCPVVGGTVKSVNDEAALAVDGVLQVITLKGAGIPPQLNKPLSGVAVIAENTWAAIQGKKALDIEWDLGPNAGYDSEKQQQELLESTKNKGTVRRERGDFDQALRGASKTIERTYLAPYFAHGTIEPPNALARVQEGKCEIWAPTQHPQFARNSVAEALGMDVGNVAVNVTLIGGGFGRKSKPDFIVEAALLAQKSGHPVRVQWTREDDIQHDFYHALSAQRIKAVIDKDNKVAGWNHHTTFPSIGATSNAEAIQPSDGELGLGCVDFPYDVPDIRIETHDAKAHLRIGWLRSVSNIHHAFAIGGMLDEIAEARKMDPVANALDMLGADRNITFTEEMPGGKYENYGEPIENYSWETGRLRQVIERVAKNSGWGKEMPEGYALGFTAHRSFLTYVACVVEVAVDDKNRITIPNVYYSLDCGLAVNTDRIRSQFEGGSQFAASLALNSEITVKDGQVQQDNFDTYRIVRMPQSPQKIHVDIVESDAKPTGVGEPPVPPFIPALCNAVYKATGKRIYKLPIDLKA